MNRCWYCHLGIIEYRQAFELQEKLVALRYSRIIDDILLVLEHPPTVTLGKFGKMENILESELELKTRGIAVHQSNRGGDVTFHCPGQLVVYPIMDMRQQGGNLRRFLSSLEEVVLKVLLSYGIGAERWDEHPGIWVDGKQIAAIGLHFKRGISMHGISLNINPDLDAFNIINLCGMAGKKATSVATLLGRDPGFEQVATRLLDAFAGVLNTKLEEISREQVLEDVLG